MRWWLLALLLAGCAGGDVGTLALSWRFADGRSCVDAGAATVDAVADGRLLGSFACAAGDPPGEVMVMQVPRGGATLEVVARSPAGVELYRGALPTDAALLPATVTLYATGAR